MPAIAPASIEPLGLDVAASAMRVAMGRGGIGCAPKDPGGLSVIVSPALAPHAAELAQRVQCPCHMSAQWVCVIHGSADPAPPESTRRMWAGFRPWPGDRRSTDYTSVVPRGGDAGPACGAACGRWPLPSGHRCRRALATAHPPGARGPGRQEPRFSIPIRHAYELAVQVINLTRI